MTTQRYGKKTLAEIVDRAFAARIAEVRVAMPATIESFDADAQLASVRPLLQETAEQEDGSEVVEPLPVICDVPVQFPGGGGYSLTFPVSKGDECLLVISDRSLDKWIDSGGQVDPVDLRRHSLSDAVAILGVRSKPNAIPSFDGSHVTLGKDGSSADFVALAQKVSDQLTALKNAISGAVVVAQDGGASLKSTLMAALSAWPSSVASGTVKIKG